MSHPLNRQLSTRLQIRHTRLQTTASANVNVEPTAAPRFTSSVPTNADVAAWMVEQLEEKKWGLYQEDAVWDIEKKFGAKFVYENDNGNPAISRGVLKEFRTLTEGKVVWERGSRMWRKRTKS